MLLGMVVLLWVWLKTLAVALEMCRLWANAFNLYGYAVLSAELSTIQR